MRAAQAAIKVKVMPKHLIEESANRLYGAGGRKGVAALSERVGIQRCRAASLAPATRLRRRQRAHHRTIGRYDYVMLKAVCALPEDGREQQRHCSG